MEWTDDGFSQPKSDCGKMSTVQYEKETSPRFDRESESTTERIREKDVQIMMFPFNDKLLSLARLPTAANRLSSHIIAGQSTSPSGFNCIFVPSHNECVYSHLHSNYTD